MPWVVGSGLAAAASLAALFVLRERGNETGYELRGVAGRTSLRAGDELATGAGEVARLSIAEIGHVEVDPDTELRVEEAGQGTHRLFLARGSVTAEIDAEPRVFQIGTPAGLTVDLGCRYDLDVDADGRSELAVSAGQVAFVFDGREVYVPAGASCVSIPGRGPLAPVFLVSSAAFKAAVEAAESGAFGEDGAFDESGAFESAVRSCEREDTLSLWHLFDSQDVPSRAREIAYERLSAIFPKPEGVTEEGLLAGDRAMRAAWLEKMKPAWKSEL
jgi:hypothetical protein